MVFQITGVVAQDGGFVAPDGAGTLTDPSSTVFGLSGKQDDAGRAFVFLPDEPRLSAWRLRRRSASA